MTKLWWLNNCLGCAFSIQGIEMLSLGSYVIGCMLLCGLFFYDVFWVFGTEVMVAVAKGINAPIKILFPKALGVKPMPLSMLGLGDIVIPVRLHCATLHTSSVHECVPISGLQMSSSR